MTTARTTARSRPREIASALLSLAVHGALVLTLSPCVPEVPQMLRVHRVVPERADPQQVRVQAAEPPPREPRDAVADQERVAQAPPEPEVPDPLDGSVQIVHTDAPGEVADAARAESLHDQRADTPRHAPVTSPEQGPDMPQSIDAAAQILAIDNAAAQARRAQSGGSAASAAVPPVEGAAAAISDGVPVDPRAPDWWAPIATRVRPGSVEGERPEVELPPQEHAVEPEPQAPEEVVDEPMTGAGERGRLERDALADAEEPTAEVDPEPDPDAQADPQDAIADAAMPGERRAGRLPTLNADPLPASSHQTVIDADLGEPAVNALATERGAWIQRIDEVIRKRWSEQDLPVHLIGIGVKGDATVRFTVDPNGRTGAVELVRKSGNEWLDGYAVSAIPDRVPRMPRELAQVSIEHEITFRYR